MKIEMSIPVFIVEYIFIPDGSESTILPDAFVDEMIARQYIREKAESMLDDYADCDDTDFVMEVSWEAEDYKYSEVSLKRPDGKLVENWLIKQLTLNEQREV